MADGAVTAREAERIEWDVIVVGTGMGGGMLGYRLAQSGRRVLFVEKAARLCLGRRARFVPRCRN